ncbi:MAG: ABC transporter ATP-binding protein [Desulfovibrio sp.]|nr:ABC transporter ATP-binding protein [Desulfovibrio sp.]
MSQAPTPEGGTPLLELRDVARSFAVRRGIFGQTRTLRAVDGVSFTLENGETLGLVGESGCGKSTLGRLACGLLRPDAGEILLTGRPLPPAGAGSWSAGRLQMVFQDPASSLNPRLTVRASVAEPLAARGVPRAERRARADEALRAVGLEGAGDRYPHAFSGGQRQRIALARALVTRPEIIVCDEPVSALDASVQAQILNLLREAQERFRPAYLFISHDLAVVGFMCRRILVMYLGQIVEEASAKRLFVGPAHPYSQALLAAMPAGERDWAQGRGLDDLPPPLPGEPPSPLAPPAGCRFHPRCPRAEDICRVTPPPWKELAPDWRARCHFA